MAENSDRTSQGAVYASKNDDLDNIKDIENIHMSDDDSSSPDWVSEASSSADRNPNVHPLDRLQQPTKYFQELDNLQSKVFGNSMFPFYTDGTIHKPFNKHVHMKVGSGGDSLFRRLKVDDVQGFFEAVIIFANEAGSQMASPSTQEHYHAQNMLDRAIENLYHFIECRNIILWVMENIEAMEAASYCGGVISMLVIDKTRHDIASLLPIQCSKIRQLAAAFETCLSKLISLHLSTALFDIELTFANEASNVCRDILSELNLDFLVMHCTEIWRCTVHVLDMAVLSYAGAHTQVFGMTGVECITLPGPFLEKQYFVFRRRSFLCLSEFLGGHEAWVLEYCHPESHQLSLPPLYLSTDATIFGDIWGPMWKTCALLEGQADHDHILRYSVGSGVILPSNLPLSNSQDSISCRKNEVFCHWVSDRDPDQISALVESSEQPLHPDDILLIGASMKLDYNPGCSMSAIENKQSLRDAGSLSELGTMKIARFVDSEAVQIQVGPPYAKVAVQRTYKRRGRTWKEALIENWKNNPEGRNIRILEYKFGVEVSACTFNARRRRLITLLGSNTMMNHLQNGSLLWNSADCQEQFYTALKSPNHKAFRDLYTSRKDWQSDLGKAITYCLDALTETGTNEKGLDLLWVPDSEPGQRVNISSRKHSWIGFLRDSEDCCTMAVLEDKCLELQYLTQVKKCQTRENGSEPAFNSMSEQIRDMSVLETSFMLNQNSVPKPMRQVSCHGHNGSEPRYSHRWSTSLLEPGEKFHFGENGHLKFIKPLGNGQILANWKSSRELLEIIKEKLHGNDHEKRHREYIRVEKGGAGPIYVLVMSSEPERMTSRFTARGEASNPRLCSNVPYVRQYRWVPSPIGRPRRSMGTRSDEMGQIMNRWKKGELATSDDFERDVSNETLARLVAALHVPVENSRGELERETNQEQGRSENI